MSVISTYLNQSPFIALCRSVRQRTDAAAREVVPCIVGVHTQKDSEGLKNPAPNGGLYTRT